jgi:hypothetical protein
VLGHVGEQAVQVGSLHRRLRRHAPMARARHPRGKLEESALSAIHRRCAGGSSNRSSSGACGDTTATHKSERGTRNRGGTIGLARLTRQEDGEATLRFLWKPRSLVRTTEAFFEPTDSFVENIASCVTTTHCFSTNIASSSSNTRSSIENRDDALEDIEGLSEIIASNIRTTRWFGWKSDWFRGNSDDRP